jgi:hypothetical protein
MQCATNTDNTKYQALPNDYSKTAGSDGSDYIRIPRKPGMMKIDRNQSGIVTVIEKL